MKCTIQELHKLAHVGDEVIITGRENTTILFIGDEGFWIDTAYYSPFNQDDRNRDYDLIRKPITWDTLRAGDKIKDGLGTYEIIFRSGKMVVYESNNGGASGTYTTLALQQYGYTIIQPTDIEPEVKEFVINYQNTGDEIVLALSKLVGQTVKIVEKK